MCWEHRELTTYHQIIIYTESYRLTYVRIAEVYIDRSVFRFKRLNYRLYSIIQSTLAGSDRSHRHVRLKADLSGALVCQYV